MSFMVFLARLSVKNFPKFRRSPVDMAVGILYSERMNVAGAIEMQAQTDSLPSQNHHVCLERPGGIEPPPHSPLNRSALCLIEDCARPAHSRGWCTLHYASWNLHGDPLKSRRIDTSLSELERFLSRITLGPISERRPDLGHCWLWNAAKAGNGRPMLRVEGKVMLAYRFGYRELVGGLDDTLTLDHLCFVEWCVKPGHLEQVTDAVNRLRSSSPTQMNSRKTHCPKGHPYDLFNTYTPPGTTHRQCRTCIKERGS